MARTRKPVPPRAQVAASGKDSALVSVDPGAAAGSARPAIASPPDLPKGAASTAPLRVFRPVVAAAANGLRVPWAD